jgi:hypothetical protein
MEATITKKFGDAFDPKNQTHVMFIKKVHDGMESRNMEKIINENPFGLKVTRKESLEFIHIQFILTMKYAISVLEGKAWVPPQETPGQ